MTQEEANELQRRCELARARSRLRNPVLAGATADCKPWTAEDENVIRNYYQSGQVDLVKLADLLCRSKAAVACKANALGVTFERGCMPKTEAHKIALGKAQVKRFSDPLARKKLFDRAAQWRLTNPHPKGMLGKHHSEETKEKIREANAGRVVPRERTIRQMKTRAQRHGNLGPSWTRGNASWKAGWGEVGGQKFYSRSRWEANYARYLQWLTERGEILKWEHEPETFWFEGVKRGCVSYLPDFKVITWTGQIEYHEVKGWMDAASATKLKRMAKYHPQVQMVLIDSKRYKALSKTCCKIVKDWV